MQEMNRTNQLRPLLFEVGAASIQAGDTIPSTTLRKLQASGSEVVEVKVVNSTEIFGGQPSESFDSTILHPLCCSMPLQILSVTLRIGEAACDSWCASLRRQNHDALRSPRSLLALVLGPPPPR